MSHLIVQNHGSLIVDTNYWGSELDLADKFYVSVNAGAVRLLLPRNRYSLVGECRTCDYVILSRGPWPAQGLDEAVELLFEDHSESPYMLRLSAESFDVLPAQPEPGREWVLTVWIEKKGRPHKTLERPCRWRRVPRIPHLHPWN